MNTRATNLKGEGGSVLIADTNTHTGDFEAILALADAVAALTSTRMTGTLTTVPIPKGVTIFGPFSAIALASGTVIAYKT